MKKIFFIVVIFATVIVQQSFAQDSTTQTQLSQLLTSYYNIKDALVSGNANNAAMNAEAFVKTINGISEHTIAEASRNALLKDAGQISQTKDISKQRSAFANFSTNMFALAKAVQLTSDPVYKAYCPMKKSYWLSSEKTIKNPYFGNAMITCGKVTETIQ